MTDVEKAKKIQLLSNKLVKLQEKYDSEYTAEDKYLLMELIETEKLRYQKLLSSIKTGG